MKLTWTIEGEKQISRVLPNIGNQVHDWTPAFAETARRLKAKFSKEAFVTQGASVGAPWAPLSPEYAAWKAKRYPGKGILVRTGKMQKSFVTQYGAMEASITNPTAYFKYHQSNAPRSRLPRRMMMYLTNGTRSEIVRLFQTFWHQKVIGKANFLTTPSQ